MFEPVTKLNNSVLKGCSKYLLVPNKFPVILSGEKTMLDNGEDISSMIYLSQLNLIATPLNSVLDSAFGFSWIFFRIKSR